MDEILAQILLGKFPELNERLRRQLGSHEHNLRQVRKERGDPRRIRQNKRWEALVEAQEREEAKLDPRLNPQIAYDKASKDIEKIYPYKETHKERPTPTVAEVLRDIHNTTYPSREGQRYIKRNSPDSDISTEDKILERILMSQGYTYPENR